MLGVNHRTVLSVRDSGGEFLHLVQGQDGKQYPVNQERYTASSMIAAVRQVFGEIDLDPASSAEANKVVKAKSFFTRRTNGLKKHWHGRIFLNPPFDAWPVWMAKLEKEIESGRVKEAIVVGPANIAAFRPLFKRSGLLFLPDERPKYHDPNSGKLIAPPFGSLICYVGGNRDRFIHVFGAGGVVLRPAKVERRGNGWIRNPTGEPRAPTPAAGGFPHNRQI